MPVIYVLKSSGLDHIYDWTNYNGRGLTNWTMLMNNPMLVLLLFVMGCDLLESEPHDPFPRTRWQLEAAYNTEAERGDYGAYELSFTNYKNGAGASGVCKSLSGFYQLPRTGWLKLEVEDMEYATCSDAVPEFDTEWFALLRVPAQYEITDSTLTLDIANERGTILSFSRSEIGAAPRSTGQ